MSSCVEAEDCSGAVQKECIIRSDISNETNFCDCSPYYGFKGIDCTTPSAMLVVNRIFLILFLLAYFINLLICVVFFLRIIPLIKKSNEQSKRLLALVILNVFGLMFVFVALIIFIVDAFDTSELDIVTIPTGEIVVGRDRTLIGHQFLILPVVPVLFSILVTVLSWLSLLKQVGAAFSSSTLKVEQNIGNFLIFFVPISAAVVGWAFLSINFLVAFISATIVGTIVIALYLYMLNAFLKPIKEVIAFSTQPNQAALGKGYQFILFSNRNLVIIYLVSLLGSALYGIFSKRYVSQIEQRRVEPAIVSRLFIILCILILYSFNAWYIAKVISNIKSSSS